MNPHRSHWFGSAFALAWLVMLVFGLASAATSPQGLGPHPEVVIGAEVAFAIVYAWYWIRVVSGDDNLRGTALAVGGMLAINLSLIYAIGDREAALGLSYNFIYIVVVLAFGLPWRAGAIGCVLIAALTAGINLLFAPHDPGSAAGVALLVLLIGLGMVSVRQMIATIGALNTAREEMARLAVSEERLRFARDLHDLLGHSLSVTPARPPALLKTSNAWRARRCTMCARRLRAIARPTLPGNWRGRARCWRAQASACAGMRAPATCPRRPTRCWHGLCAKAPPTCSGTRGRENG
jgi:two-component system sensor histidine kinase DesK